MVGITITPENNTLSINIPDEMIGREIKVVAYAAGEETDVVANVNAGLLNEEEIIIPQWQKDLVLAEQKRVMQDPSLLVSWETVKMSLKN